MRLSLRSAVGALNGPAFTAIVNAWSHPGVRRCPPAFRRLPQRWMTVTAGWAGSPGRVGFRCGYTGPMSQRIDSFARPSQGASGL